MEQGIFDCFQDVDRNTQNKHKQYINGINYIRKHKQT